MSAPRGVAVVLVSLLVPLAAVSAAVSPGYAEASVAWPVSTGLVLAEVVTGGASASDEYVEIYNAAAVATDLGGCELIYVTASGATTTRKAAFDPPLMLAPGAHLLVANSAGAYGPLADATYTGGLSGDGGSLALRHVGGAVIDAVSWGTASNAYVEGAVAPAPPARSSLERRPGGAAGNWEDTNDNASDWMVQSNPIPQSLASTPVPAPSSSPPDETATATPLSPPPSGETSEQPSSEPTFEPTAQPTAGPTAGPSASPAASASPNATATLGPTAAPTPTPAAPTAPAIDPESVAAARSGAIGSLVHVSGVVTVTPGLVGADNLFAIADSSGGIFVRLAAPVDGVEIGRSIDLVGVLAAPYGQLEVRELEWLELGVTDAAPKPIAATLPEIGEGLEGSLVTLAGTIDSVSLDSGRLVLTMGDKQTELRVLADPPSGIVKADVTRGEQVTLTGIVGQRATALGREDGYRLWLRMRADLQEVVPASPSPTAASSTAGPSASPAASASPNATATLGPTAAPTPTPAAPTAPAIDPESVAAARSGAIGSLVHVSGVVTVTPGLVGADNLFAIADSSGGIFVRLAAPVDGVEIGRSIDLVGVLAAPYGQLEVRELEWLELGVTDAAPKPIAATLPEIGEGLEGSLVTLAGTIDSVSLDSGRLVLTMGDKQTELRVLADPPSGIVKADVTRGEQVTLTGIVGQRATALGREDGYRLWLRMRADLQEVVPASPSPTAASSTAGPSASPAASASPAVYHDLASGLAARGRIVDVDATVTAAAGLIDWGGPTIVVDDGTAAVAVVLPDGVAGPRVGAGVHIVGKTGSLHSGPRVVATLVEGQGEGVAVRPRQISGALGPSLEWQLGEVCGRVQRLTRAGSRWRADLAVDGQIVAVLGEPGAGIDPAGIVAGRLALATGIVRRSTSDPSVFQLLPRSGADLTLGPAPTASGQSAGPAGPASASRSPDDSFATEALTTIAQIPGREGETVTLAGLIVDTGPTTATLDDGTGRVRLGGADSSDAISLLEPGDAVEVTGIVSRDADGWLVEVDPDRIVTLAGQASGGAASSSAPPAGASPSVESASGNPASACETPAARGQAHGLALPAGGGPGSDPTQIVALVGGGLALLALLVLLGLTVARAARERRLHRPGRPRRSRGGSPEAQAVDPSDGANAR